MKYRQFEDLPVWKDSANLVIQVYEFTVAEQFRRHYGLRDQLERAVQSISNNIAEGFERGSTTELLAFLYIARGSAGEARSMLRVLQNWSAFGDLKSQISNLITRSENISRQLYGWIESLKNSEITGQRHLDDGARMKYTNNREKNRFLDELNRINKAAAEKRSQKN